MACNKTICSLCLPQEVCVADGSGDGMVGTCEASGPKGFPNIACPCPPKTQSSSAGASRSAATASLSPTVIPLPSSPPSVTPPQLPSSSGTVSAISSSQMIVVANGGATQGVIEVPQGYCASVTPDPLTGERLVYCCLDELFTYSNEATPEEYSKFVTYLNTLQKMRASDAKPLFEAPYDSAIHRKYKWPSVCGRQISCNVCQNAHFCGNSVIEEGEACDTGPLNSDTRSGACRTNCTKPECGDGVTDPGEQCDGGSRNSDTITNACRTNCMSAHCGDGTVDDAEQCDAGLDNSDTQPNADCRMNCLRPRCGDNIIDTGEECDAGLQNGIPESGCTSQCTIERVPRCGDGIIDLGEQCDDATLNANSPDHCRESCVLPHCGDGIQDSMEECDDGTRNGTQNSRCSITCTVDLSLSLINKCGDGIIDPGEECDAHKANLNQPDFCRSNCRFPRCGDGIRDSGEQCDLGPDNGKLGTICRLNCRSAFCGDGKLQLGEQCDDGNLLDGDGCSSFCQITPKSTARTFIFPRTMSSLQQPQIIPRSTAQATTVAKILPPNSTNPITGLSATLLKPAASSLTQSNFRFPLNSSGPSALSLLAMGGAASFAWMRRRGLRGKERPHFALRASRGRG